MNQVLPNTNEWSEFLSNQKKGRLLAGYFTSGEIITEKVLFGKNEKNCYIKRPDQIRQVCPLMYSEHKEGPALPSFEEINQEQNNFDSLSDLNQERDTSALESDEESDGLYISDENDD